MILVVYQLDVLAEKQKEFVQVVPMILKATPRKNGCLHHHLCRDLADDNHFFVIETWKDQQELDAHWRSDRFGAFLGTSHLLKKPLSVKIHAISFTAGMEAIQAVRAKISRPNIKEKESKKNT